MCLSISRVSITIVHTALCSLRCGIAALPLDFCNGASGLGSRDARRRECGRRNSGVQAGGGRSAGEERRAAPLIFQVSGCKREGIGDSVQAGGGGSADGR